MTSTLPFSIDRQPTLSKGVTHSLENTRGYTPKSESKAKVAPQARLFLGHHLFILCLSHPNPRSANSHYPHSAQFNENKIPYRASQGLNSKPQGRLKWPIGSKEKWRQSPAAIKASAAPSSSASLAKAPTSLCAIAPTKPAPTKSSA